MDFWKNQLTNMFDGKRLDQFIESMDQYLNKTLSSFDQQLQNFQSHYYFDIDSQETDDELVLSATLPISEHDRVKLDVVNQQLRILIQRFESEQIQNDRGETLKREDYSKRIERYIPIPPYVSTQKIKASMTGKQLTIRIPKNGGVPKNVDIDFY